MIEVGPMKLFCNTVITFLAIVPSLASASLVTHFNFNSYDGDSSTINANSGSGVMTLAAGGGASPTGELSNPTGTTLNTVGMDSAGLALSLGNAGRATGIRTLSIGFSTTGFSNLVLSYAGQASNSAYDMAHIEYSINGGSFVDSGITFDPALQGSFNVITQDLSGLTSLNNKSSVALRLTLSGGQLNSGQDLLIDNLQINAVATPEAHAVAMMAVAALLFLLVARQRRMTIMPTC